MSVAKIVMAIGIATAVVLLVTPLESERVSIRIIIVFVRRGDERNKKDLRANNQPSSRISFLKVGTNDKSVLNILKISKRHKKEFTVK